MSDNWRGESVDGWDGVEWDGMRGGRCKGNG